MKIPDKDVHHVDLPELQETFVDSIGLSTFDGNSVRINLCVTRMNPPTPPKPPSFKRYPAVRLVATPQAVIELYNHLNNMVAVMEKQGLVKREGVNLVPQKPEDSVH